MVKKYLLENPVLREQAGNALWNRLLKKAIVFLIFGITQVEQYLICSLESFVLELRLFFVTEQWQELRFFLPAL